jgi:hypothetical protein
MNFTADSLNDQRLEAADEHVAALPRDCRLIAYDTETTTAGPPSWRGFWPR